MTRIRVVAVAAAVVSAVTLTGCARPGDVQAADAAALAPSGPDVLAGIVGKLYGTAGQREAGLERQHYAWQAALGRCMTGKGADFGSVPYAPSGQVSTDRIGPGEILAFAPQRTDFSIAARTLSVAKVGAGDNPALTKLSGEQADAWLKIQAECEPATKATEELAYPAGLAAPSLSLQDELIRIQGELAPDLTSSYRTCMAAAGVDADDLSDVMTIAGQKYPPVTFDKASDPTRLQGWAAGVAYEKSVAAQDWKCRGADASRVVNASGEKLTVWAAAHQAQLDEAAAQWAAMPAARDAAKAALTDVVAK